MSDTELRPVYQALLDQLKVADNEQPMEFTPEQLLDDACANLETVQRTLKYFTVEEQLYPDSHELRALMDARKTLTMRVAVMAMKYWQSLQE